MDLFLFIVSQSVIGAYLAVSVYFTVGGCQEYTVWISCRRVRSLQKIWPGYDTASGGEVAVLRSMKSPLYCDYTKIHYDPER